MYRRLLRKKHLNSIVITIILLLNLCLFHLALAADPPILYLFWGEGCPHCADEKGFLKLLQQQYPALEMRWFEVWDHPEFAKLADQLRKAYQEKLSGVPMTILGDQFILGFSSYEETGRQIAEQVKACLQQSCPDALEKIKPQSIVTKIRDEAAKNKPEGWALYPAAKNHE